MDNPVQIVKSNANVGKIVGFIVVGLFAFAILDLLGITQWLLFPVTTAKAKLAKKPAGA